MYKQKYLKYKYKYVSMKKNGQRGGLSDEIISEPSNVKFNDSSYNGFSYHLITAKNKHKIDAWIKEQTGGTNYIPPDEFNKRIVVMDRGGFILPNGAIVYPNGKVVCPENKPDIDYQSGGSSWLKNNIYNLATYKWLHDS